MSETNLNPIIVVLIAIAVLAIAIAFYMYVQKKRTERLRSQFGPEYDKTLDAQGSRSHAEQELEKRTKRVSKFEIRPLKFEEQARLADDWRREQSLFVDNPPVAVDHADKLVQDVMKLRGYPVGEFDQNAADLSVDHPQVVQHYRIAHDIALQNQRGGGNTEDLRKAMVSYHLLFDDLLELPDRRPEPVRTEPVRRGEEVRR